MAQQHGSFAVFDRFMQKQNCNAQTEIGATDQQFQQPRNDGAESNEQQPATGNSDPPA